MTDRLPLVLVTGGLKELGSDTIAGTHISYDNTIASLWAALSLTPGTAQAAIDYLAAQSALKAPLASPTFTGTVTLPTGAVTSAMIADGTIVDADIASGAAIALSKHAAIADQRILGNVSGGSAAAIALTATQTQTFIGLSTDTALGSGSPSNAVIPSQAAVKAYSDAIIAAADAMVFKGVIDCSANPNYPAADRGATYKVSVAGKIGGSSGINVEVGDTLLCITDGTASGNQATVGSAWNIVQANLDGAVIGPASVTDSYPALFDGTTGKLIKAGTGALGSLAYKSAVASADITDGTIVAADLSASAAIALSQLATQSTLTLVGNSTGGTAVPTALSASAVKTLLAIASGDVSGLGSLATKSAVASADITDGTIVAADISASAAIALSQLATQTTKTYLGNTSGSTAVPTALSVATMQSDLGIVTASATTTLTNKRNTKRITTVSAPGATPTFNTDNCDQVWLTAIAANITNMSTNVTGTPVAGDFLVMQLVGNSTYNLSFGSLFVTYVATLPTALTTSKVTTLVFQYNAAGKSGNVWYLMGSGTEA